MTSGLNQIGGGENDPVFFRKSWNGADGTIIRYTKKGHPVYDRTTPHDYHMRWVKTYRTKVGVTIYGETSYWWHYVPVSSTEDNMPLWGDNDELKLLSKLASKIKGHSFNGGVFIAEGREALTTVTNSSRSFFALLNGVLKRDPGAVLRALGNIVGHTRTKKIRVPAKLTTSSISSTWLALQYAWKPLLSDIFEAMKAFEKLYCRDSVQFRASHAKTGVYEASASPSNWDLMMGYRHKVTYRYTLKELPSEVAMLGLLDPEVVAWELVPFSFVIDWFIPIGTYLEDRAFFRRLSGSWVRTAFTRRWVDYVHTKSIYPIVDPGIYQEETVEMTRTCGTSPLDVPLPDLKTIGDVFSPAHVYNAAALVVGLTRKARSNFGAIIARSPNLFLHG